MTSVKTRAEQISAPFVGRGLRLAFRSRLPLNSKVALWKKANNIFFHHASKLIGTDALGNTLHCRLDDFVQRHIAIFGIWEPTLTKYLLTKGQVDGSFVDIGANVGYFSLLAAKIFTNVISFEPSPSIFQSLQQNIKANELDNIKAFKIAISDHERIAPFYRSERSNSGNSSLSQGAGKVLEDYVRCAPLRAILGDEDWSKVCFVKIDVEGHELEVLRSLLDSPAPLRNDIEIVVQMDSNSETLFCTLREAGFCAFDLRSKYTLDAYLSPITQPLIPIEAVPSQETDCLFKREMR
jgi:FkbM family methyltransferase